MNILHVISDLDPAKGGPATVVKGLSEGQARCGQKVWVVVQTHRATWWERPGVPVVVADEYGGLLETIEHLNADFVHLHGLWCSTIQDASRACIRLDVPFAIAPHGALGAWSMSQKALKKRVALKLGYGKSIARARFVHVNNSDEYTAVNRRFPAADVREIPHGIDSSILLEQPGPEPFLRRFSFLEGVPFVLFLGRLAHQKAPDLLIRAFETVARRHPAVHLALAGPDDGRANKAEQESTRLEPSIRERIHFLGPIYDEEKWSAYQAASVFCLPSRYESFGLTIVEAMSCRSAVVITDTCFFPDVSKYGAGLIARLEEQSLAEALSVAVSDANAARTMGERGQALVREKYTWDAISKQVVAEYKNHLRTRHD